MKSGTYANPCAAGMAGYLAMLATPVSLMLLGPGIDTSNGPAILAPGQKMVIHAGIMCWFHRFPGEHSHKGPHSEDVPNKSDAYVQLANAC